MDADGEEGTALRDVDLLAVIEQIQELQDETRSILRTQTDSELRMMPLDFGPTVTAAMDEVHAAAVATGSPELCSVGGMFEAIRYWAQQTRNQSETDIPEPAKTSSLAGLAGLLTSLLKQGEEDPFVLHNFLLEALGEKGPHACIAQMLEEGYGSGSGPGPLTVRSGGIERPSPSRTRRGPNAASTRKGPVRPIIGGTPTSLDTVLTHISAGQWVQIFKRAVKTGVMAGIASFLVTGGGPIRLFGCSVVWALGIVIYQAMMRRRFALGVLVCFMLFVQGATRRRSFEALSSMDDVPTMVRDLLVSHSIFGMNTITCVDRLGDLAFGALDPAAAWIERRASPVIAGFVFDAINVLVLRGIAGSTGVLRNVKTAALLPAVLVAAGLMLNSYTGLITGAVMSTTVVLSLLSVVRCIYFGYSAITMADADDGLDSETGATSERAGVDGPAPERILPYSECALNQDQETPIIIGGRLELFDDGASAVGIHLARCIALAEGVRETAMRLAGA